MKKRGFTLAELIVVIAILALLWLVLGPLLRWEKNRSALRLVCATNMHGLGAVVRLYANEYTSRNPTAHKWCDLVLESDHVVEKQLVCKAATMKGDQGRCHYAINPNAEPNSPGDIVLLFETKGGWNQFGGPEILSMENHPERWGKGCNVLFNDGRVRWIKAKHIGKLKWKDDQE